MRGVARGDGRWRVTTRRLFCHVRHQLPTSSVTRGRPIAMQGGTTRAGRRINPRGAIYNHTSVCAWPMEGFSEVA
jgi:hypothetical protein